MKEPRVVLETPCGNVVVALNVRQAPLTSAHFLEFARLGYLARQSRIYRIVTQRNSARSPAIDVVQFGWVPVTESNAPPLPPVPHEPTSQTGLTHVDGTLSLARLEPGTGTSAFFLCVGDQPVLDAGGARAEDGAGFAAFGRVVEGRSVLGALHARAGASEWLTEALPIGGRIISSGVLDALRPKPGE